MTVIKFILIPTKKIRITIYSKKEIKLNLVKAEQKISQKLHFA